MNSGKKFRYSRALVLVAILYSVHAKISPGQLVNNAGANQTDQHSAGPGSTAGQETFHKMRRNSFCRQHMPMA
jgi:hypothetical protein